MTSESTPPEASSQDSSSFLPVIRDVTCLACGCLCDDIVLTATGRRIIAAEHACEKGRAWFLADHEPGDRPEVTVEGRAVERAVALDHAAEILAASHAPILLGLNWTSIETQAAAVALADLLGAVVDPAHSADAIPRLLATQRVGRVSATLGEIKNRADVIVFWGVDPMTTHPRHWERYSVAPAGRFVPEGRSGRSVLVADRQPTETSSQADLFLPIDPANEFETLWTLRALVRGQELDPEGVRRSTGMELATLTTWADRLRSARYGALFFGPSLGDPATVEAVLSLVRDLNETTRFVAMPLGAPANATGAENVLAWQTGFAVALDFARGYPRSLPGETDAQALLSRGEADAALIVADDPMESLSQAARDHLARIPRIIISPQATSPSSSANVGLMTATPGIHAGGSVLRADGVGLPLRPSLTTRLPTDRDWLEQLRIRLRQRDARTGITPSSANR